VKKSDGDVLTADLDGSGASSCTYTWVSVVWILSVWQSLALCTRHHDRWSSITASRCRYRHRCSRVVFARPAWRSLHWWIFRFVSVHL